MDNLVVLSYSVSEHDVVILLINSISSSFPNKNAQGTVLPYIKCNSKATQSKLYKTNNLKLHKCHNKILQLKFANASQNKQIKLCLVASRKGRMDLSGECILQFWGFHTKGPVLGGKQTCLSRTGSKAARLGHNSSYKTSEPPRTT